MGSVALTLIIAAVCVVIAESEFSMKIGEFNENYAVYLSYRATAKTRILLSLFDSNSDIQLCVSPRYNDDDVCGMNRLVANTKFNGIWQDEMTLPNFSFLLHKKTSITALPKLTGYLISFDHGSETRKYTFHYRHNHSPTDIVRVQGKQYSHCSVTATAKLLELSVGRMIPTFTLHSSIQVLGIAPADGQMIVDVSLGLRTDKDDARVALRMAMTFDTPSQALVLQHHNRYNHFVKLKTLANLIFKSGEFSINIVVRRSTYLITVNGADIATYPTTVNTLCHKKETATVWVTGATAVNEIAYSTE